MLSGVKALKKTIVPTSGGHLRMGPFPATCSKLIKTLRQFMQYCFYKKPLMIVKTINERFTNLLEIFGFVVFVAVK